MIQAAVGFGVDEIVDHRPSEIPRPALLACAPGHGKIVA
jgi:hypothetical protein